FHTFSYSPLAGPGGQIAGMLCVVIEDTVRVIGDRQLSALTALATALAGAITEQEVFEAIERGVEGQKDMPCTLTYLFDEDRNLLRLVAKTGIAADHPAACTTISADSAEAPWPIHMLLEANRAITVEDLPRHFTHLPAGCWDKPPAHARMVRSPRPARGSPPASLSPPSIPIASLIPVMRDF